MIEAFGSGYSATAYGIYIGGDLTGTLTNSGTVKATGIATGSDAYVYGIYVSGNVDGALTNNGTITVLGNSITSDVYAATGIYVNSGVGVDGSVVNAGTINVTAISTGDYANAAGIYVSGTVEGEIRNDAGKAVNVTATAGDYSATAYGIWLDSELAATGSLINNGTIAVTVNNAGSDSTAHAYGVYLNGYAYGDITNTGSINVHATNDVGYSGTAYAIGLYINDDADGTVINSGTISAAATGSGTSSDYGYGEAYGLYIGGSLDGDLINSGTISAVVDYTDSATGMYGYAYGVYVGSDLNGSIDNSGTINAEAYAIGTSYPYAYGVLVEGNVNGLIDNSGTITAAAEGQTSAYAYGVLVGGDLGVDASIVNGGSITASANATSYSNAYAYGIAVSGGMSDGASILNSGSISANATAATYYALAFGIYVGGDLGVNASITNSGSITAAAHAGTTSYGTAYGIYVGNLGDGASIANSGSISVTADGSSYGYWGVGIDTGSLGLGASIENSGSINVTVNALRSYSAYAYGIYTDSLGDDASIVNSGTITVTASAATSYAEAFGIATGDLGLNASIANSGSLVATANGGTWATAYGIRAGNLVDASIANSGTITATANGATGGSAYGIRIDDLDVDSTISNSGTITATAPTASRAVSVQVGSGSGTVTNSGTLIGSLNLGGTVSLGNSGTILIPTGGAGYGSVGGNYTQSGAGVLGLGVTSTADYATFSVGGTADFTAANTLLVRVDPANTLLAGDMLAGAIQSGTLVAPNGFTVSDNNLAFNFAAAINGNDVDLTASATGLSSIAAALGGSSAAQLGGLLDSLLPNVGQVNPQIDAALFEIGSQTTAGGVANVVSQLEPLMSGGVAAATLGTLHATNRIVQERLDVSRGQSSGDYFVGNNKAWLKPFGSWAEQDADKGAMGYKADSYGFALGAEGDTTSGSRVGLAVAYARSDVDSKGVRQEAKIDSYQLIGYASKALDVNSSIDYQADVGIHDTDGKRTLLGLTAKSNYDSWNVHLGAGYNQAYALADKATFTASYRADYTYLRSDAYTETGAGGLNLKVNANKLDELLLSVEGKYTRPVSDTSNLIATLGVSYDTLADRDRNALTSSLVGAPTVTFNTFGVDATPWMVRGGLGLVMNQANGMQVTARYDVEGRDKFINQTASVKVRWAF